MAVKSNRSERLLSLKGNVWWYRQGVPQAVHKVTGGPSFILINLKTSDVAEAKRHRDELEGVTRLQFDDVRRGRRLSLELDGWRGGDKTPRPARAPADRGTITRTAMDTAQNSEELYQIVTAAEAEADAMRPAQRKAFEDAMSGKVEIERHLETYLTVAELAPKTTKERRGIIMRFARWCTEKGATLDRIDRRMAGEYVAEIMDPMHHATQKKHLTSLRQYWIYLARRGHVKLPTGVALSLGWPWNEQAIEKRGTRVERGGKKAEERPFTDSEVTALIKTEFPLNADWEETMRDACPSSYKMGHQSGLNIGGSGSVA